MTTTNNVKLFTEEQAHKNAMQGIAQELQSFFEDRGLWSDVQIYFNKQAIDSSTGSIEDICPTEYIGNANKDTVTVKFENGFIYNALNIGEFDSEDQVMTWKTKNALISLLQDHGYMYVLGHNGWNFSIYRTPTI